MFADPHGQRYALATGLPPAADAALIPALAALAAAVVGAAGVAVAAEPLGSLALAGAGTVAALEEALLERRAQGLLLSDGGGQALVQRLRREPGQRRVHGPLLGPPLLRQRVRLQQVGRRVRARVDQLPVQWRQLRGQRQVRRERGLEWRRGGGGVRGRHGAGGDGERRQEIRRAQRFREVRLAVAREGVSMC